MRNILISALFGLMGGFGGAWVLVNYGADVLPEAAQPVSKSLSVGEVATIPAKFSSLNPEKLTDLTDGFVEASKSSTESVVYIKTISQSQGSVSWMDWFFGGNGSQQVLSSGSGVIFSEDGHVVTNNHVIDKASKIEVIYKKKPYSAKLIGTDPSTDLAVLRITGEQPFRSIKVGKSANVEVGEWVLAVGNPFNLNSTVTAGIVSAKGRDIDVVKGQFPLESFIQTDAAINPGNSGGALVNLKGELVGINTAIYSHTGSYSGYGFAVPSDIVKKVVNDIVKYGRVQKAYTGAEIQDLDYETAKALETEKLDGVVVGFVHQDGAADQAGLERGDIIRSINGKEVESKSAFDEYLSLLNPGDKVSLEIFRKGKTLSKAIVLTNEDGTTELLEKRAVTSQELGADFEVLSKREKDLYGIDHGVKIKNIRPGIMQRIGVKDGFVLRFINKRKLNSEQEAIEAIKTTRGRVYLEGLNPDGRSVYYTYIY